MTVEERHAQLASQSQANWKELSQTVTLSPAESVGATEIVKLFDAKIELAKAHMLTEFNRELFADGRDVVTLETHWHYRYRCVKAYFSTLWRALKGEQPYDDY